MIFLPAPIHSVPAFLSPVKKQRTFSKHPVKTYPQPKIKFRGITFEAWTVTDYSQIPGAARPGMPRGYLQMLPTNFCAAKTVHHQQANGWV